MTTNDRPAVTRDVATRSASTVAVTSPPTVTPVVIEPRVLTATPVPPSMQWTLGQLLAVLTIMAAIVAATAAIGWSVGGRAEPTYGARSEFIYFLEDAMPDGFLREDRRILTQLVTAESQAVLGPVAAEFDMATDDLREHMSLEVVDLSEVVRLQVEHRDPQLALELNTAILDGYNAIAEANLSRGAPLDLDQRRAAVIDELARVDAEVAAIAQAEVADVALASAEESIARDLDSAATRVDRLSALADGQLLDTAPVDDGAAIMTRHQAAVADLRRLEAELLEVRTELVGIRQAIAQQVAAEVPTNTNDQRAARLSARAASLELEIERVSERIRALEGLEVRSLVDEPAQPDVAPVEAELVAARALVTTLEAELVELRTERAELALGATGLATLQREIGRLERDLADLDAETAAARRVADSPSPIEILAAPHVLAERVDNARLQGAAIGFLAGVPLAMMAGALVRQRQRRRR